MKRFLLQLFYFLPILLFIMCVNYFEDPANLFQGGKYEFGIVNYLLQGYNVTNVSNYDERLLQKYFIERMVLCPDEIVLGSSRIMLINNEYSGKYKLINNGVSGATLEDDMAIFYLYEKRGCKIKKVILGLDPYLLNDHNDEMRWKTLGSEYNEFAKMLSIQSEESITKPDDIKFSELFSVSYFKTSFRYLIHRVDVKFRPTTQTFNEKLTRLKDGSIAYGSKFRNISSNGTNQLAHDSDKVNYLMSNFITLSERYKDIFSKFINYLQEKDIEVDFFLPPYHPLVYNIYLNEPYYWIVPASEKFFTDYAKEHNIKVFGSFDPGRFNLDNSYFYDGEHAKEKAIKLILESSIGE